MNDVKAWHEGSILPRRGLWYLVLLFLLSHTGGCASNSNLFYWGNYEESLYERYVKVDAAQAEAYVKQTIQAAEGNSSRVSPGLYADYAFLLYRRGDYVGAIRYFEKEKQLYPESSALMSKLIQRIKQQQSDSDDVKQATVFTDGRVSP